MAGSFLYAVQFVLHYTRISLIFSMVSPQKGPYVIFLINKINTFLLTGVTVYRFHIFMHLTCTCGKNVWCGMQIISAFDSAATTDGRVAKPLYIQYGYHLS